MNSSNDKSRRISELVFIRSSVALAIFFAAVLMGSIVTQALNVAAPFGVATNNAFAEEPNVNGTTVQTDGTQTDEASSETPVTDDAVPSDDISVEEDTSAEDSADNPEALPEEDNQDPVEEQEDNVTIEYEIDALDTDQSSYNQGDAVLIEGAVNHVSPDGGSVVLSIINPENEEIVDDQELDVSEETGSFEFEFTLSDDAQVGEYSVTAHYVTSSEETATFDVTAAPSENDDNSTDESLTSSDDAESDVEPVIEESTNDSESEQQDAAPVIEAENDTSNDNNTVAAPADEEAEQQNTPLQEESNTTSDDDNTLLSPTIWTDKDDYAPGDTVTISGSGFLPDSTITLSITHPDYGMVTWTSQSDKDGTFETTYRLDGFAEWYTVTAADEASNQASVTFHDTPKVGSVSVGSQSPSPVTAGNPATYTVTVNRGSGSGSSGAFTASLSITSTLPSGVTASFASSSLSFSSSDSSKSTTLTLSTSSSTPTGAHSFTVKAQRSDQSTDSASGTGSLSISAPADSTAPTTTASPAGGSYNSDQSVTLTADEPATIYYSTDGSTPTTSSTSGTSPVSGISITTTATLKFFAKDTAGNAESVKTEVYTIDKAAPVITVPDDIVVEATGPSGAVVEFETSTSNDGSAVTCNYESGDTFPIGTTTVECEATDGVGNTGVASFTITVQDTTAPTITVPNNMIVEAAGASGATVAYSASATDATDGEIAPDCDPASGSVFSLGETTVTCEATDTAGNTDSASFTITVQDTLSPTLTLPDNIVTEATSSSGAAVSFTVTAQDAVDSTENIEIVCNPESGSVFPLGETTVECEATDNAGNSATGSFTVTIEDTTAPALTLPDDIIEEATSADGAVVEFTATAEDGVDGALDVECAPASGGTFAIGQTTVECQATDTAGNAAQGSFTVTVQDTTSPEITVPADIVVEATGASGATVEYSVSASDVVDGDLSSLVECDPISGSIFAIETTEVSCEVTDSASNTGSASFFVTVQDTTAPTITVPADITVEATSSDGAEVSFTASASDAVDGESLIPDCDPASGSTFPIGTTTVTCEIADIADNTASDTFTVTVEDTTAPVVTAPADITVEATGVLTTITDLGTASASDTVDGSTLVTNDAPSSFPLGTTTVTYSSTDNAGNTGTDTQAVTVADTTAPTLTVPDDIVAEATSPSGAAVSFDVSASDSVAGEGLEFSCDYESGDTFPLGATTVECEAADGQGNTGTASFTITVQDTAGPTITVPADITASPTSASGAAVTYSAATATDVVDSSVSATCTPASGSTFAIGTTTVNCSATDDSGNTASKTFKVTVTAFTSSGFFKPIDMGTIINTAKGGSTVPLKFEVFGGTAEMTNTAVIKSYTQQKISCTSGPTDAVGTLSMTGNTGLRYDTTSGQFIANWKTPTQANTCWKVIVTLQGDNAISALFKLN